MYIDGDYAESKTHFSEVLWGPTTTHYVARAQEMGDGRWAEVFHSLNDAMAKKKQVEYASHGGPRTSDTRRPVPDSDNDSEFLGPPDSEDEVGGDQGTTPLFITQSSWLTFTLA